MCIIKKDVILAGTVFFIISILALSLNACSATIKSTATIHQELNGKLKEQEPRQQKVEDVLIGHAYYFKCPYYECNDETTFARPLFKKTENDWQVFPNDFKDIGNTPDNIKQSYKLFPEKIKWNIFNDDYSLIGNETVENKKPVEWAINAGAAQMHLDPAIIKQTIDQEIFYDPSSDLVLSTNNNVIFSKFSTRKTTDVEIYESAIKGIKDIENSIYQDGTIEKRATVYSVENIDVIAILYIEKTYNNYSEMNGVVLVKNGDKWVFAFDGKNLSTDVSDTSFSLKTIADFDNDGKSEYIFNLFVGFNGFGYVLWYDGITKPLVYKYYSH